MAKKRHNEIDWTDEEEEIIWVSKSEIKRDSEQLKKLGAELIELSPQNLAKIPLDEDLKEAIRQAQNFKSNLSANYSATVILSQFKMH